MAVSLEHRAFSSGELDFLGFDLQFCLQRRLEEIVLGWLLLK